MKKLMAALCALLMLFAAGCKSGDKTTVDHPVDIAYFADTGEVPGAAYKVGDAVPEQNEDDDTVFFVKNGAESFVSTGDYAFYYDAAAKDPAFYAVDAFSECYGFEVGAISIEITNVLDSQGIKYTERNPGENELFFLPGSGNRRVIECTSLKHKLIFVFESNALCAAAVF